MTKRIEINITEQALFLLDDDIVLKKYPVSTAKNGAGERMDSECTPRGRHAVVEKIGAGYAPNTVFVGRQATGETYQPALRELHPERDWILTRILWLGGEEPGINQGGEVDSQQRYIYIHGSPDDVPMGMPGSRGCIRMRNEDVMELFDIVDVGTKVVLIG